MNETQDKILPDEISELLLTWLNRLAGQKYPFWKLTNANKEHIDEFGIPIRGGETYIELPGMFANRRRLSFKSARTLWDILIADNNLEPQIREWWEEDSEERLNDPIGEMVAEMLLPDDLRKK